MKEQELLRKYSNGISRGVRHNGIYNVFFIEKDGVEVFDSPSSYAAISRAEELVEEAKTNEAADEDSYSRMVEVLGGCPHGNCNY